MNVQVPSVEQKTIEDEARPDPLRGREGAAALGARSGKEPQSSTASSHADAPFGRIPDGSRILQVDDAGLQSAARPGESIPIDLFSDAASDKLVYVNYRQNLILLGDHKQLDQPQKVNHPDGSQSVKM